MAIKRFFSLPQFCAALLFPLFLASAIGATPSTPGWRTLDDLAEARIGVISGTSQDLYFSKTYPQAQIIRFNSRADQVLSLKVGRVDVITDASDGMLQVLKGNPEMAILEEGFDSTDIAAAFRKTDPELRQRFDQFIQECEADGSLDQIRQRWMMEDPEKAVMPTIPVVEDGAPLNVGIALVVGLPYATESYGQYIGFDIELAQLFSARKGFKVNFVPLDFDGLIAALSSGKIDIIVCSLSVTEERKKAVDFSVPYTREFTSAVVLKKNLAKSTDKETDRAWKSLDNFAKSRIGVISGTAQDLYISKTYPQAQIIRFNSRADQVLSLKTGRVDVMIEESVALRHIIQKAPELTVLSEGFCSTDNGAAFRKTDQDLRQRFNQFLADIEADGTMADMRQRWLVDAPETAVMPDIPMATGGPLLKIGTAVILGMPFAAVIQGQYVGFEIELAERFAARAGFTPEFVPLDYDSLVAALASGKIDIIVAYLAITEERSKAVDFSVPYTRETSAAAVLQKNLEANATANNQERANAGDFSDEEVPPATGWWEMLKGKIQSNFIVEQRWKLVVNGLWITILISVAATFFGSLLGAGVCALRMSRQPFLRWCGSSYISIVRGLPVLLMLMLIFYVVFASININPVLVAVIAFGMNFAAYVAEMFRTGIESIDRGQTEAGIAMGFTRFQTFCRIVLPQATRRILPVYRGEFISLVKMTSVVGYIGVQDLTKAGDIIRSRTFDAFFPLLKVAALYFLVIWLLGLVLDYIERKTDPKATQHKRART